MKTLELNLKKIILIVEFEDSQHLQNVISCHNTGIRFMSDNEQPTKFICKGNELTEESASELVFRSKIGNYKDYSYKEGTIPDNLLDALRQMKFKTAKESFISAIEVNNMFWEKHNIPYPSIYDPRSKTGRFEIGEELNKGELEYNKAESKTFNPSKTLIFEII